MSTVVNLAANVTATGTTNSVPVPLSRFYLLQIAVPSGTAEVTPELSLDGTNWFSVYLTNVSGVPGVLLYAIQDFPVIRMRLNVTGIDGATVRADVAAVY